MDLESVIIETEFDHNPETREIRIQTILCCRAIIISIINLAFDSINCQGITNHRFYGSYLFFQMVLGHIDVTFAYQKNSYQIFITYLIERTPLLTDNA